MESQRVDQETRGAEVRSAGARASRSSEGGRSMGGARAGAGGGPMEPEPEPTAVEVPAGRVLRCGAARPGGVTGTVGWAREGDGVQDWTRRPRLRGSDPASSPAPVSGNSSPPARAPRSCPSARMAPRTSSPTARRPRRSDCACAAWSSGSCWRRSAWSACEGGGPGRGRGGRAP